MAATTFFAQASANRRNSFLLALFVVAILGLLGFVIGYAIVGDPSGGVAARATSSSSLRPVHGRSTHRRRPS